ncbi:MAG TPA: hypothetical protein VFN07_07060 [Trueperaceae bacterium]|nr:hypothetical protein [Trueperaceae bacterium]HRP46013.1 hypothetical protein [Trueperaceae bacterium]
MTVEAWVLEAVEVGSSKGVTLRNVQRHIDERHFEELAVDTLEAALVSLQGAGKITLDGDHYFPAKRTSKEDAMKKLFGDG